MGEQHGFKAVAKQPSEEEQRTASLELVPAEVRCSAMSPALYNGSARAAARPLAVRLRTLRRSCLFRQAHTVLAPGLLDNGEALCSLHLHSLLTHEMRCRSAG